MSRSARIVALVVLFALAFFAVRFELPYYEEGPGPAQDVLPLIDVKDHQRFGSEGKLIMTTVSYAPVTPLGALVAWIDPDKRVVHRDVLFPPGLDRSTEQERAISQMDTSKIAATSVVMKHLTDYPKEHGDGALIEVTGEGCPAFGELFAGDIITAIDGETVDSNREAMRTLDAIPDDEPIDFTVRAAGETHEVSLTRERCVQGDPEPKVGISTIEPFPFPVTISSGEIGGPSAGLMFALGLYDTLTPGDLTGGRTIAGTGEIAPNGAVGPIGGITDKVIAAERVGATVFLVPEDNMAELEGVDVGDMQLISVATFDQALKELEALGGTGSPPS